MMTSCFGPYWIVRILVLFSIWRKWGLCVEWYGITTLCLNQYFTNWEHVGRVLRWSYYV